MPDLDPIDLGVLAFVGIQVIIGFARGFVWQLVRLITLIAALAASRALQPQCSEWLRGTFPSLEERFVAPTAYFSIFAAVFAAGTCVAFWTRRAVAALRLSGLDRLLGGVVGLARGALLVLVVILVIAQADLTAPTRERLGATRTARVARQLIRAVGPSIPDEIRARVEAALDRLPADPEEGR